jgi:hypothetical protein
MEILSSKTFNRTINKNTSSTTAGNNVKTQNSIILLNGFHTQADQLLIPEALVAYIFSYLNFKNVFMCSIVSKYLYKCSQVTTVVNITSFDTNFQIANLKKILTRFNIIKSLYVDNCKKIDNSLLADIVAHAKSANNIKFEHFFSDDLQTLILLNGVSKQLQSVKISGVTFLQEQTRNFLTSLMTHRLKVICLNGFRTLSDNDIENIFTNSPNLSEAAFEDCTKLKVVSLNASQLKYLSLSRCACLEGINAINLKKLEHLNISNCRSLKSDSFQKLICESGLKCIKNIDMRFCSSIEMVSISGKNPMHDLVSLNMEGCTSLNYVTLKNNPFLSNVRIGMCLSLEDVYVIAPKLQHLDLSMMSKLRNVNLDCRNLKTFDCSGSGLSEENLSMSKNTNVDNIKGINKNENDCKIDRNKCISKVSIEKNKHSNNSVLVDRNM